MIYKIIPDKNCKICKGTGIVTEWHDYGSTRAPEDLHCDCILEQLPEDYDFRDEVEIIETKLPSDK